MRNANEAGNAFAEDQYSVHRDEAARRDRWSGLALILLMIAAAALVGQRIVEVASGPLPVGRGQQAPALGAMTVTGEELNLGKYGGQVVLVDFWATWCPPCVAALPGLERIHGEYGSRGFTVLGVNQEPGDEERVRGFMKRRGLTFPSLVDPGALSRDWGVFSFPTSFLIGRDGVIRSVYRGPVSESRLRRDIEDALSAS